MKKIFCILGIAALLFGTVGCKKDPKIDVNDITEDGVYVIGEATGATAVSAIYGMAKGRNEAKSNELRDGMYEKYIVLEGGKDFSLVWVNGGAQTAYGATLAEFKPTDFSGIYQDNPADAVFKGKLEIGEKAPKMKVSATGLYHIVLDLNLNNDLDDAQILVSPVQYGVRGGMNSWGFTALEATAPKNDGITYTLTGQKLGDAGEFKFAYNNAWKITLDAAGGVKANTNLGKDGIPGGDNIVVADGAGLYKIVLEFKLAAGDVKNSWKYTVTQESKSETPTTMYMIGNQFGGWDWNSEGVVELVPVWGKEGAFWCTRYFNTDGFKFCAEKAWNGDFTGLDTNEGYTVADGNCFVPAAGFYTVYINLLDKVVEIKPAEVFGLGNAVFTGGWDFNDAEQAFAEGDKMVIVTSGAGELRLASKVIPTVKVEGCGDFGWYDWWKTEFIFFADNKIAYRGAGGDQERVQIEANKKIIIDFNAGTVAVEDGTPFVPAITIDGDMTDWTGIAGVTEGTHTLKATSDERYIYLYSKRANSGRYSDIWGGTGYVYFGFDLDNNSETGDGEKADWGTGKWETLILTYPYAGTSAAMAMADAVSGDWWILPGTYTINNLTFKGALEEDGAAVEYRIPRSDMAAVPTTEITINAWGNKDLSRAVLQCVL